MCGIAGYNVSPDFARTYIDEGTQARLLQEAWLRNVHRGADASGYFALDLEKRLHVYKIGKQAPKVLTENMDKIDLRPSYVFGAHTRAATKGHESNNTNNHPVHYNGIWVTHNGGIRNDEVIKNSVRGKANSKIAEVDSVAINILLNEVNQLRDVNQVARKLQGLDGGFAIHAIAKKHPGLSILGRSSNPMILAIGEDAIFYGSEFDSVWHMIHYLGLDPNDEKRWRFRSLDQNTVMLVENGTPIGWGKIPITAVNHQNGWNHNKAPYYLMRVLPAEGEREAEIVYATDSRLDFAQKAGEIGRDFTNKAKDDRKIPIYSRINGHVSEKDVFPRNGDSTLTSVFSEADEIVEDKVSDLVHSYFGDVEIITTRSRTVVDVYNHALFKTEDRWDTELKEKEKTAEPAPVLNSDIDFETFFIRCTTKVNDVCNGAKDYKYVLHMRESEEKKKRIEEAKARNANSPKGISRGGAPILDISKKRQAPLNKNVGRMYLKPIKIITWLDVDEDLFMHNNGKMFFIKNEVCGKHSAFLTEHSSPEKCPNTVAAAAYAVSCLDSVELTGVLLEGSKVTFDYTKMACENNHHQWIGEDIRRMYFGEVYYDVVIRDECSRCGTSVTIDKLPRWLDKALAPEQFAFNFQGGPSC